MKKIAVLTSHPIQYHAPLFRHLAAEGSFSLKVFYLWDFGVTEQVDRGFRQPVMWDIPLLSGYDFEFVPNVSSDPGTHHFRGLNNPSLAGRVTEYDPDAVLMIGYNYISYYRFLLNWDTGRAPLFFRGDSHRLMPRTGLRERARRELISSIFRRFSAFLYVGQANYNYLRYHGVPAKKLFFAPHAVDNERFFAEVDRAADSAMTWRQELGIPDTHAVILFAGKFEPKKRPLDLLRAFVQARLEKVTLLFVGSGPVEEELRRQASGHPHIRFAPFQNQTLMPRTYLAADLMVLPSYGGEETWGLAVNEAMCMSRPVIASTHVGCAKDLIRPYENGLVFPAGDVAALSVSLKEALSNRERLREWGEEGRRVVCEYSYYRITCGLKEAFAACLQPKNC